MTVRLVASWATLLAAGFGVGIALGVVLVGVHRRIGGVS